MITEALPAGTVTHAILIEIPKKRPIEHFDLRMELGGTGKGRGAREQKQSPGGLADLRGGFGPDAGVGLEMVTFVAYDGGKFSAHETFLHRLQEIVRDDGDLDTDQRVSLPTACNHTNLQN